MNKMNALSINSILSACVLIYCTFITVRTKRKNDKILLLESELVLKKGIAYQKISAVFFNIFQSSKNSDSIDYIELQKNIIDAKSEITLYASDDVFIAFNDFLKALYRTEENNIILLDYCVRILLEIRKDMFNKHTKIKKKHIIVNLLQSPDEIENYYSIIQPNN